MNVKNNHCILLSIQAKKSFKLHQLLKALFVPTTFDRMSKLMMILRAINLTSKQEVSEH